MLDRFTLFIRSGGQDSGEPRFGGAPGTTKAFRLARPETHFAARKAEIDTDFLFEISATWDTQVAQVAQDA